MRTILLLVISVIFSNTVLSQDKREFEMKQGDTTYLMKRYYMGFLKRVADKPALDSTKVVEIQMAHQNYMAQNIKDGTLLIAGPFGDDGDMRGIVIYDVATQEEAENIIKNDPAVKAGRLDIEIHPWWAAKGSVLK